MCGICGVFYLRSERVVERGTLAAMNREIVHRGPDDEGFYLSGNVGLAIRRLSIIDLHTGHQPIANEDSSIWIVFNGEIYNHQELRKSLEQKGHRYRSHSDTESIIHLYEEYGQNCVRHLRGMFAFAIWDAKRRVLFAARDRLGIKPLYYLRTDEFLLFASEIKALLAHPGARAEFNRSALPEYLTFGYLAGSETMFAGIQKLLPGHTLEVHESGHLDVQSYWDVPQGGESDHRPRSYYVQTYRDLLEQSVESHLMSDVPLGVFLSGGVDSSLVAALMTKIRKDRIETFSVGYDEEPYSELPYARVVATHLRSRHHEVRVSRQDFFRVLPSLIWHEDEPLTWPGSVPLYFVARLAREHVKVVLTGEGSDETLGGYSRYGWSLWNARFGRPYCALVPAAIRRAIRGAISETQQLGAGARRRLGHTFLGRDTNSWASLYFDNFYSAFSEREQQVLLLDGEVNGSGVPYRDSLAYWEASKGDLLTRMLYTDIKTYLVELCMKQDQMSMAASVESRVPFLDHVLVEFAARIPGRFKVRGLAGKLTLKESAADLLPKAIIHRPKVGFSTPLGNWLRGAQLDQIQEMLLESRSLDRKLFKPEALQKLFAEHRGRGYDRADQIWRLLNLELWQRVFMDRDSSLPRDA
ncbi:MAG: asparagine synthase (glutamine-hydrolyzing) [Candidatus Acidiferrales bacterium]